jgi:hypothetical protein
MFVSYEIKNIKNQKKKKPIVWSITKVLPVFSNEISDGS